MKLPWDRNYIKISFHIVVTALILCTVVMAMANLSQVLNTISAITKGTVTLILPLIIAIVIAFLFNPGVDFFQKKFGKSGKKESFKNRKIGTITVYLIFFLSFFLIVSLSVGKINVTDMAQLANEINLYVRGINNLLLQLQERISYMGIFSGINGIINEIIIRLTQMAVGILRKTAQGFTSIGGVLLNVLLGFVVAFYLLLEKDRLIYRLKEIIKSIFPLKTCRNIFSFFRDVNMVFSGYVVGQLTDAVIMAVLITGALWAVGINYAVLIGVVSGFSNLIPYIGAVVAFVLAVLVALLGGTPAKALYAAIIIIILQQIDGMIIVPRVVGKKVKLHPILVLLALSVFGNLFGLWGMLIAVPVTALIKIFFDRFISSTSTKNLKRN